MFRSTRDTHVKRNLMVFLRPTVVRDRAGLAALSGKKYNDIRIVGEHNKEGRPAILPRKPVELFDGQQTPEIDLRKP
ncbi:Type II secretion system protein D precursor [compost metagenome]